MPSNITSFNECKMSSLERFNIHAQLEHLQSKYHGTGHVDITKWEWVLNIHRDSLSSHVGHYTRQAMFALVENCAAARIRKRSLEKMAKPVTNIKQQNGI